MALDAKFTNHGTLYLCPPNCKYIRMCTLFVLTRHKKAKNVVAMYVRVMTISDEQKIDGLHYSNYNK